MAYYTFTFNNYEIEFDGAIWLIEGVAEARYNIERPVWNDPRGGIDLGIDSIEVTMFDEDRVRHIVTTSGPLFDAVDGLIRENMIEEIRCQ